MIKDCLEAFRFLTVFPLPRSQDVKPDALAQAMLFFPFVGFLIGVFSLVIFHGVQIIFPERIATFALLLTPIAISGGLHLDGFADFCDGFFGGKDRSEILRIMRDSRIGVWGAAGIILLILAKFEFLQVLPDRAVFFLMALTTSRWAQVVLSFFLLYAGDSKGLGASVARKVKPRQLFGATIFLLPIVFWLRMDGFLILGGICIFLVLLGVYFKKKIGGVTGDVIGATSELTELLIFVLATALVRN